jgi:3-methyladenine DNA glycosylase Mpg
MELFKKLTNNDIHKNFNQIAKLLFFNSTLTSGIKKFRICEIEFYVYSKSHKDIFTHRHSKQQQTLKWYFHQMSEKENSYKSGTYKGIDIAFGSNTIHAGILIRSLYDINTDKMIDGPCKVVDEILKSNNISSMKVIDLISGMKNNLDIFNNNCLSLSINSKKIYSMSEIFKTPRIGLTLKKKDNMSLREKYIAKPYRCCILPSKIKKCTKMTLQCAIIDGINTDSIIKEFDISKSKYNTNLKQVKELDYTTFSYDSYKSRDLNDSDRIELYKYLINKNNDN